MYPSMLTYGRHSPQLAFYGKQFGLLTQQKRPNRKEHVQNTIYGIDWSIVKEVKFCVKMNA